MYQYSNAGSSSSSSHPKRRKKRPIHGVKSVAVTRGRSGYGFTISGQHPCVLSCIVTGSPADEAGLKAGDYLLSVNNENVSKAPHDDVVRMVGISTGTLTLQVAENYNSSDSSDDEYHHRSKARYPNRIRTRVPTGGTKHGDKVLSEFNPRDRHSSNDMKHKDPHAYKSDLPKLPLSKSRTHVPVGAENSGTPQFAGPLSVERRSTASVASVHATPTMHHPLSKQAIVKGISQSARTVRYNPIGSAHSKRSATNLQLNGSVTTASISSILKTSVNNTNSSANNAFIAMEDDDDEDDSMLIPDGNQDVRIVVGYIGSIEMPSDADKPHIRVQSIRNAVRRLRIEQKIHTLVLMQVSSDGVKLSNAMGTTVAHYPVDRLAFSGICPDDKRFFGIVTLHSTFVDEVESDNGSQDESASSGSCHVFMVDPEMHSHNIHAEKATVFGINCSTAGPERQNCAEFPRSATQIILAITNLYKNRPGAVLDNEVALSQAFADPTRAPQRSNSNSSNSDSGLGFSRDDAVDRVLVVDMPPPADRAVRDRPLHQTPRQIQPENSSLSNAHCSPDNMTIPTPLRDSQRFKSVHANVKSKLNASVMSNDDFSFLRAGGSDKFNIRAMPDPANSAFGPYSISGDGLDKQSSAESLRASMHKVLKARKNSEHSSDQESTTSQGKEMLRSTSQPDLRRPVSAPPIKHTLEESFMKSQSRGDLVETIDMDDKRLSPRAFLPPPFHQLRSPSAPPVMNNSFEMDDDMETTANTSVMGNLIERFEQDQALRISSPANVSRRFSEGHTLFKQREKEKTTVDDGERWAKPHSVRHRKISRLQQPLSHSHESLVAIENEMGGKRLSSTGSANNINSHHADDLDEKEEEEEIGRIAGWAVNFEKLLKDSAGLAVFTEFLKKEFSEENIVFWRICEQFKSITDTDRRKIKAKEIFTKHISVKASDPVNIEHDARQQVEKQLENPSKETFDKPQQEIFKLMKQDSYRRFIKSELYKKYLMREMSGEPLCLPSDDFQGILGSKELKEKKKTTKGTEEKEKRRRSLLPWRQKSSKQSLKATSDSDLKKSKDKTPAPVSSKEKEVNNNNTTSNGQKRATPGPGIDLSTIRKEVQANTKEKTAKESEEKNFKFCRVILPDGSTTVVCAKPGQTIRSVLGKLCDKRSLSIASVDVFLLGSDKPLDLSEDISTLGSREVMIERRVLFRMDLPNKKSIGVKAKPNRSVRDVFKPILNKYGFKLDSIWVQLSGHTGLVDIDAQVSSIDNQRVIIHQHDESNALGKNCVEGRTTSQRPMTSVVVKYPYDYHIDTNSETTSLDVITNRIFDGLMKGKSKLAHNFDELGILDPDSSQQVQVPRGSGDRPSLGLFGLRKKEVPSRKAVQVKGKSKLKVTFDLQKNQTRKTPSFPDDDKFLDLLSRVQGGRLDDQRGLDMKNSEIPEFLRNHYPSGRESAPPVMFGQRTKNSVNNYFENDNANFTSYTRGHILQRPSSVSLDAMTGDRPRESDEDSMSGNYGSIDSPVPHGNQSFSADGIIPTTREAEEYFQSTALESVDFDDPCMADKSVCDLGYSFNMYQAKAFGYSRHRPYTRHFSPDRGRSSLEDITPTNPDFDDTLLASPSDLICSSPVSGHIRSNSVPLSLPSPNNETVKTLSPIVPNVDNKLIQEGTPNGNNTKRNVESSQQGSFLNGVENDSSSAFHSPPFKVVSSSKVMTIDLDSDSEENVTFV